MKTRWERMIFLFQNRPHDIIAEVGVWKGIFAANMLRGLPDIKKYYCIDPWKLDDDHKKTLRKGSKELNMSHSRAFQIFKNKVKPWRDKVVVIRKLSQDALVNVPDNSLDGVFIDANHSYPHTKADIIGWSQKVKPGGLISGHDIIDKQAIRLGIEREVPFGVRKAVEELLPNYKMNARTNVWWCEKE